MNPEECESVNVSGLKFLTKKNVTTGTNRFKRSCFKKNKVQTESTNGEENGELSPNPVFADGEKLPSTMQQNHHFHEFSRVPLVEIDSYYISQQTFVTIGGNKRIHRFTRSDGPDILSPFNALRRTAIFILTDRNFKVLITTTVLAHCLCLGSSLPAKTELMFLPVYVFELIIKIFARGIISDQFTFLRLPWNWLDLIIVIGSFVTLLSDVSYFGFIRTLTIFKIVPLFPGLLKECHLFAKMLTSLLKMGAYLFIAVIGLAITAHQLFSNSLKSRCVQIENVGKNSSFVSDPCRNESTWFLDLNYEGVNWEYTNCGDVRGSRGCPEGYSCVQNCGPNDDWTSFDTFPLTVFTVICLLFQDNTLEIYRQMWNALGPRCTIFFGAAFFAGTFAIGIIVYGIVGVILRLKTAIVDTRQVESVEPEESIADNDQMLLVTTKQKILHVTEILTFPAIILDISVTYFYTYEFSEFPDVEEPVSEKVYGIVCTKICILCYTLEVIVKMICKGPKAYLKNGWDNFNVLIATFGWINLVFGNDNFFEKGYYIDFNYDPFSGVMVFLLVNILQLRALKIVPRCATLKAIVKIFWNFFKVFGHWVTFLLIFLFIFSCSAKLSIGPAFSTQLHSDKPIPRWNFADLSHTFMTIFRLLAGEWVETFRTCYTVSGNFCFIFYVPFVLIGQLLMVICAVAVVDTTVHTLTDQDGFLNTKTELEAAVEWVTRCHICQSMKRKFAFLKGMKCPGKQNVSQRRRKWIPSPEIVDKISSAVILLTWIPLVFEYYLAAGFEVVFYTDILFVAYSASEIVYRVCHRQFKICLFDSLWVSGTVCSLFLDKSSPERLFFVAVKSCRLIMTVTRIENLRVIGYGLGKQLQTTKHFLLSGVFIWVLFAMKAIWEFNLLFYKCIHPSDNSIVHYKFIRNREDCLASNFTWIRYSNFDGVKNSFLSLTQVASLNGFSAIAEDASDIRGIDEQQFRDISFHMQLFFIPFFIFGVFLFFNVLFGVVFLDIMKEQNLGLFMTKWQLEYYKSQEKTNLLAPFVYPRQNNRLGIFHDIVSNWRFDIAIMLIILIDVLSLTLYKIEEERYYPRVLGYATLAIYTAEFIGKLFGWGRSYWLNVWNILDFSVVVYGIFDLSFGRLLDYELYSALVRGGRLLRVLQFQPLLCRCRILSHFLTAFILIRSALCNLLMFLSILVLIFGALWSRPNKQDFDPQSPFKNHQSIFDVLLDVFQVLTFSGWNIVTQGVQRVGQNCQGSVFGNSCVHSYPISYVFLCLASSFWITMNMYLTFIWEFIKQFELKDTSSPLPGESDAMDSQPSQLEDNIDNNQEVHRTSPNLPPRPQLTA